MNVLKQALLSLCIFFSAQSIRAEWEGDYYNNNSWPQEKVAQDALAALTITDFPEILDLGCGSGRVTELLAKKSPTSRVTGNDASESMVQEARKKYTVLPNITFSMADAQKLNYNDQFHLVVSFSCLHWIKDKDAVFKGITRALKPGGTVLFAASGMAHNDPILLSIMDLKKQEPWSKLLTGVTHETQFFPLEKTSTEAALKRAGLTPLEVKETRVPLRFKSKRALADWFLGWFVGLPLVSQLPKDKQEALITAVVDNYAKRVPAEKDGSIIYVWPHIVAKAQKPAASQTQKDAR